METDVTIGTRLAAVILLKRGEITVSEIQALPFVDDAETADEVAERLVQSFDAQRLSRRRRNQSLVGTWEEVVRLQSPYDRSPAEFATTC